LSEDLQNLRFRRLRIKKTENLQDKRHVLNKEEGENIFFIGELLT